MPGQTFNHLFNFLLELSEPASSLILFGIRSQFVIGVLNQLDIRNQFASLALSDNLLNIVGETRPRWSLSSRDLTDPLLVIFMTLAMVWDTEDLLIRADSSLEEFKVSVERLGREELIDQ